MAELDTDVVHEIADGEDGTGQTHVMPVEHVVTITHSLRGRCPVCGIEVSTSAVGAVKTYDHGRSARARCTCGVALTIPGASRIVRPGQPALVPAGGANRHERRAAAKINR